jgi:hypothetical protein
LLADVYLVKDPGLGVNPPEPYPRSKYLRERPKVNHPVHDALSLLLECGQGGEGLTLEAEHAVGVVFDDDEVELAGYLE